MLTMAEAESLVLEVAWARRQALLAESTASDETAAKSEKFSLLGARQLPEVKGQLPEGAEAVGVCPLSVSGVMG